MEKLKQLLQQVSKIVAEEKVQQEEKRKRGENFNIFNILGLARKEVRLHSAFLAELLNPNGDHGLGTKFLKAFIQDVVRFNNFDEDSAKVHVEYYIGPINEDKTEGGQIDLLIHDKKGHYVVIENKIDARDQENQLLRYHNYVKDKKEKGKLFYLTPYGTEPSDYSLGKTGEVKYKCINYNNNILNWLKKCLGIAALHPGVREIIQQYMLNLKQILNIMNDNNKKELLEVITSKENAETAIYILEQNWEIQTELRKTFVEDIKENVEKKDLICEIDEGIKWCDNGTWIHIRKANKDLEFRIGVIEHNNNDGFRMGIYSESLLEGKEQIWDKEDSNWPYGWAYLWSASGEANSGRWWRWDEWNTLRDMVNGKMLEFINKQIDCIIERKLLE